MLPNNNPESGNTNRQKISPKCLKMLLKTIGNLNRSGMKAGNSGNFAKAFLSLEDALSLSRELDKKCLEAKLLNNLGILYTMSGAWDQAMLKYEKSLVIVADHYGTGNGLYKTLQKNINHILMPDLPAET